MKITNLLTWFNRNNQQLSAPSGKEKQRLKPKIQKEKPTKIKVEIDTWKKAIERAKHPEKPRRDQLQFLYDQYEMDGHLSGTISKIKNKVLAEPFVIVDEKGIEKPDVLRLFLRPWFYEFLSVIMQTELRGHTLVNFDYPEEDGDFSGEFTHFDIIPRENVVPEFGQVLLNLKDEVGIPFREGGEFTKLLLEIGKPGNLGLLHKVGLDITWKRHARNDWARRSERFGDPLSVLKTDESDESLLAEKENALSNMGQNGYMIIDPEEELEFVEAKNADGHLIYKEKVLLSNDEVSKLFTGNTMTSDSQGGQYKGEIHERVEEHFIQAKMRYIYFYVNFNLLPFLKDWGYPLQGLTWKWRKWIDEENERNTDQPGKKPDPETDPKKGKEDKEALNFNIPHPDQDGVSCCSIKINPEETLSAGFLKSLLTAFNSYLERLHQEPDHEFEKVLEWPEWKKVNDLVKSRLFSGVEQGFGKKLTDLEYNKPDYLFLKKLQKNVYVFSAFKNYQLLVELNSLLIDESGNQRNWNSFKKEALLRHEKYNVNHLAAEYNTAIASAQGAAKWQRFQEDIEDYFLKITTAGDARVRASHNALDGITLPPDDDFWKTHWIPFDWQCRCNIIRVPRAGREATDLATKELPRIPKMFANNTSISGVIFPDSHSYFDVKGEEVRNKIKRAD